jgi:hypothetical protein
MSRLMSSLSGHESVPNVTAYDRHENFNILAMDPGKVQGTSFGVAINNLV